MANIQNIRTTQLETGNFPCWIKIERREISKEKRKHEEIKEESKAQDLDDSLNIEDVFPHKTLNQN